MNTEHFLVPSDFSEQADHALACAIGLASKLHARLTLLHVVHTVPLWVEGDMGKALPDAYLRALEAQGQQELEKRQQRVQEARVSVEIVMVRGLPFERIIDMAQDRHVDLIIMGMHGRTGLQYVLIGSVAEKVVRLASCPVLIVR